MNKKLAGCIITDSESRVLLIHRSTPRLKQWELPGGKLEAGETAAKAAARETLEEIGLKVDDLKMVGQTEFDDNAVHWHYSWFKPGYVEGTPTLMEPETFDRLAYFNLLDVNTSAETFSPNILAMISALKSKEIDL